MTPWCHNGVTYCCFSKKSIQTLTRVIEHDINLTLFQEGHGGAGYGVEAWRAGGGGGDGVPARSAHYRPAARGHRYTPHGHTEGRKQSAN